MNLSAHAPAAYLAADDVIDADHPAVRDAAATLRAAHPGDVPFARAAFELARDEIRHSCDAADPRVTLRASDVLRDGVGLCFAKSHLLAAMLRAEGVPAGLCYQRLTDDGETFVLHGLVAVHLQDGWHRLDPRGNKPGVDAQFSLTSERLAWPVRVDLGERDYPQVLVAPDRDVVRALRGATNVLELCRGGLPSDLSTGSGADAADVTSR
ncbi:transglutaminase-like domain-containing protein [Pengzhenrongella sicca]|uniref:transglutaminase-like domain-containing protein n=1 Tax=Pengzhenrongella sicca TaxID=2819238 RepID=UPI001D0CC6B4|nr:transglutaminase family protein [Pengzhenrongella sicca]